MNRSFPLFMLALMLMLPLALAVSEQEIADNPNLIVSNPDALSDNPKLWDNPQVMETFFSSASPAEMQTQIKNNLGKAKEYFAKPGNLDGTGGETFLKEATGNDVKLNGISGDMLSYDKDTNILSSFPSGEDRDVGRFSLNSLGDGDKLDVLPDGTFKVTKAGVATTYDVQGGTLSFTPSGQPMIAMDNGQSFNVERSEGLKNLMVRKEGNDYTLSTYTRDSKGRIIGQGNVVLSNGMRVYGSVALRYEQGVLTRIKIFDNMDAKKESMESFVQIQDTYFKAIENDLVVYLDAGTYVTDSVATKKQASTLLFAHDASGLGRSVSYLSTKGKIKINLPGLSYKQDAMQFAAYRPDFAALNSNERVAITSDGDLIKVEKFQQFHALGSGDLITRSLGSPEYYTPDGQKLEIGMNVVDIAKDTVGTRYVWGGNSLTKGVDCSGLTQQAYKAQGVQLPRTASEQSVLVPKDKRVTSIDDLRPGDMVFFKTGGKSKMKNGISHAGIYIGDGKFIHARNKKEGVIESSLEGYWASSFGWGVHSTDVMPASGTSLI